jgi:hypothetical protein
MSQKDFIIKCVRKLLDSDIYAKTISEETDINIHVVRKLKNKEQSIESTNFDYIARLFDFYLQRQNIIEAQQDVEPDILSERLPKSVLNFIDDMTFSINKLNISSEARVSYVYVYDKYKVNHKGNTGDKETFIELNETMALNRGGDIVSKPLNIIKKIDSRNDIKFIDNVRIAFYREKLLVELKKLKKVNKCKIKLFKYEDGSIGIKVMETSNGTIIKGIEKDYLDILLNEEV